MLKKWLSEDGKVCTGSQACQAFALRLGILPEDKRTAAASQMHRAVVEAVTRLTTGNLCTLYLMEMLTEYGYIDTAWELLMRRKYPSWGYMVQNGATTIWERFELKRIRHELALSPNVWRRGNGCILILRDYTSSSGIFSGEN